MNLTLASASNALNGVSVRVLTGEEHRYVVRGAQVRPQINRKNRQKHDGH